MSKRTKVILGIAAGVLVVGGVSVGVGVQVHKGAELSHCVELHGGGNEAHIYCTVLQRDDPNMFSEDY